MLIGGRLSMLIQLERNQMNALMAANRLCSRTPYDASQYVGIAANWGQCPTITHAATFRPTSHRQTL